MRQPLLGTLRPLLPMSHDSLYISSGLQAFIANENTKLQRDKQMRKQRKILYFIVNANDYATTNRTR